MVGVDVNEYLLREATALTRAEGCGGVIEIREGDATDLPFEDQSFDAVYSATVFEELDAAAGIAEVVRVTKPGGRIGVVVRSSDLPQYWHLDDLGLTRHGEDWNPGRHEALVSEADFEAMQRHNRTRGRTGKDLGPGGRIASRLVPELVGWPAAG